MVLRTVSALMFCFVLFAAILPAAADEAPISEATEECLGCHTTFHPGIVADWFKSRHATVTPAAARAKDELERRVSAAEIPEELRATAVGCAECHMLRNDQHADTFDHNGMDIHVVVSPDDCATCHSVERDQYRQNTMSHAHGNLAINAVYQKLEQSILGPFEARDSRIHLGTANDLTRAEACYSCHGTRLRVTGIETRETDAGELEFPVIDGWPNQGVGRINLDGSKGACTACHTRHRFAIEMARKPHTCKQCHVGPDVPVYKVYSASKHGNIYEAMKAGWQFENVPWTVGQDFEAPTCAVCHVSLVVDEDGVVVSERSHRMNDRIAWRQFGLIYAHAHPKSPDTTKIQNKDNQPLPTAFDGTPAHDFLIDANEQARRTALMQQTCRACHDASWINGHWQRYDNTLRQSNAAVAVATGLMSEIWQAGYADPTNPFDESIERRWSEGWLFYGNSTRFSASMAGGGDYGVFANGRFQMSQVIMDLQDWLNQRRAIEKKAE